MGKKEAEIIELVNSGKLQLFEKAEIARLKKATKDAQEELANYKRTFAGTAKLVFECNCEGDPCTYIDSCDPDRRPREPMFCPKDGNSCRWKEIKKVAKGKKA